MRLGEKMLSPGTTSRCHVQIWVLQPYARQEVHIWAGCRTPRDVLPLSGLYCLLRWLWRLCKGLASWASSTFSLPGGKAWLCWGHWHLHFSSTRGSYRSSYPQSRAWPLCLKAPSQPGASSLHSLTWTMRADSISLCAWPNGFYNFINTFPNWLIDKFILNNYYINLSTFLPFVECLLLANYFVKYSTHIISLDTPNKSTQLVL